ncbi:MAG: type IV secretory system conjugative DNA transfer family protein, partial [Pseudomonadota bacterium]
MNSGSNKESNNNNYKFFYGLIFLVANILGFGLATEWVAYRLNYPAILGEPIFIWFDTPIYNPFSYINWILKYNDYAPIVFSQAMLPIVLSTFIAMGVVFICKMLKARSNDTPTTYGSARFANPKEIETSGLRNEKGGVVLGLDQKNQYLLHNGAEHIKVIAPTRSGKGVGLVIPTLLNWQHSVVVNDIKGELWRETSGWRKQFSYVIAFDPTHKATARFNPLFEVRLGDSEIKDVQNITSMIVDPEGKGKTDHWSKEADAYLVAVILHILYAEPNKTLAGVYSFINDPNRTLDQTLQIMLTTRHLGDKGVHPVVAMGARAMLNKSPNEKTGVHSSAKAFLSLYVDPIVAAATSESDFRIMDLQHLEKPVSLYLIFPPSDMERLKPLFRLILTQITARLTEAHNPTVDKQRLLLLLDEFPSLGKLAFFETALGYTAGYGIKAMLISQNY